MLLPYKKIFFTFLFNVCLFSLLIIGLQNSSRKNSVNFLINETVKLPIGFIVGCSFISGSILGTFLNINFDREKNFF